MSFVATNNLHHQI